MLPISPAPWAFAVCALLALPATAQHHHHDHQHHHKPPAAAATPAPLPYTSALQGYQPFADEKVRSWKESNATVGKIGGWRAYAKEAAEPDAKSSPTQAESSASSAKTPKAPADPHAGHGKQ